MRSPQGIVGYFSELRPLRTFRSRALIFGILIAISIALALFPQRYRVAATLAPTDPQSLGLSGAMFQLGAINSVFGNQAAIEVALRVGNSVMVRDLVIKRANLEKRLGWSRLEIQRWLYDEVDIRSLRGGIITVEMKIHDADLARDIVKEYSEAMRTRLAEINRQQTGYKRQILLQLTSSTSDDLAKAQSAYDNFRLKNTSPDPMVEVDVVASRIPMLEISIKAKQMALDAARQLYTDDNVNVRQIRAEIASLEKQLANVRATNSTDNVSVGQAVAQSSELFKLQRNLMIQRTLYDSYLKFLEGTTVENLTSTANVRILEPAYVDTERQFWWPAVGAGVAFLLLWGAIEFFRLRPPVTAQPRPA